MKGPHRRIMPTAYACKPQTTFTLRLKPTAPTLRFSFEVRFFVPLRLLLIDNIADDPFFRHIPLAGYEVPASPKMPPLE